MKVILFGTGYIYGIYKKYIDYNSVVCIIDNSKQKNHKQHFIIVQQKIINYESARRIRWIDLVLLLRFCFVS